jgi:hypothetical protein
MCTHCELLAIDVLMSSSHKKQIIAHSSITVEFESNATIFKDL